MQSYEKIMTTNWQNDRAQLSHNWLQNGVIVALYHAMGVVIGRVRVREVRKTLNEDIIRWCERHHEFSDLLIRFEAEMSPKVFFDQVPLCRCSDETKEWLIPLTHELWMRRENVKEKNASAMVAFQTVECAYEKACSAFEALPESPVAEDMELLGLRLRDMTTACETLARAISAFPHEIRCV